MKIRFWLQVATVGLGLTVLADNSRVTASTYIQNGLIAQWDGIDNAGTGTHDSAATAWIDRVNGRPFSLYNTVWQNGKTLHFDAKSAYGFLSGDDTDATFGVVASLGVFETALSVPKTFSKTILKSTANVAFNVPGGKNNIEFQFRNNKTKTYAVSYNTPTTVAAVYTSSADADFSVYGDGKLLMIGTADSVGGNAGGGTLLGCRNSGSGTTRERYFGGDIWAIRLYSRILSQEELKINAALDQVRFFGVTADVNTVLPTGWGVGDDGVLCHLYANEATLTPGQVFNDFDVEFAPGAHVTLSSVPTAESVVLTASGKKITVKGAVTFTLPEDAVPGTYALAHADEIVLADGASVTVDHLHAGYLCTSTVTGTDISVEVAYDTSLPPTAEWIGGSTGRADDPASWICRRSNGEVIENGLPTAEMQVLLPDGCAASFPVGAAFSALEVILPATLGADCDWSGIVAPLVGKLDLKGHKLTVSQLVGTSTAAITDTTNYELLEWIASQSDKKQYIDTGVVPKTPLVGEFDLEKLDSTYDVGVMGYRSTDAVVDDNNFFLLSYYGGWRFTIGPRMLDGPGVVRTGRVHLCSSFLDDLQELKDLDAGDTLWIKTGTPHSYESGSLFLFGYSKAGVLGDPMRMRLFSCKLDDGQGTVFRNYVPARRLSDGAVGLLDLAHLGEANEFYKNAGTGEFVSGPVTNAHYHSGATASELRVVVGPGQMAESTSVTFTGAVPLVKEGAGALTWVGDGDTVSTSVLLYVSNGVFTASQGISLAVLDVADGATFSAPAASIPVESLSGDGTVTGAGFAFGGADARWTMMANDSGWTKKVALSEVNAAALVSLQTIDVIYAGENPTTLEISPALGLTTETLPALTVRAPDGKLVDSELKIREGQLVLEIARRVFEATWTGTANDGDFANTENWSCVNGLGQAMTGVPDGHSTVYVEDANLPDIPAGTPLFAAKCVVLSGTMTADRDWRGLTLPIAGKLDLKGHTLTVSQLAAAGAAEITDSNGKAYQLLESITSQSDRKQYIDTGVVPKTPMVCEFDFEKLDEVDDTGVIGYRNTSSRVGDNNFFPLSYYYGWSYSTGGQLSKSTIRTGRLHFRSTFLDGFQELKDLTMGDVLKTSSNIPHSYSSGSLFLFGYSKAGVLGDPIQMRLYSCKIDDGQGNVFRHFVPVRRLSDGAVGLLDLAHLNTESEFYGNAGSGVFTAGTATGMLNLGATGGELHVVCADEVVNDGVALTGSLKLVKEGAGTFVAAMKGQTYFGGTEVKDGLFALFNDATKFSADQQVLGLPGSIVRIEAGAELNLSGTKGLDAYPFELNGGRLGNWSFNGADYSDAEIGPVTLLADSYLETPLNLVVRRGAIDLGGHTLYLAAAADKRDGKKTTGYGYFYLDGTCTMVNGTLETTTMGGWFANRSAVRDLRSVELKLRSALRIDFDIQVNNLELIYNSNYAEGDGNVLVNGVFTPTASKGYHRNCVLQDGATLNLASKTDTWSVVPDSSLNKCNNLTFAEGATITVIPPESLKTPLVMTSDGIDPDLWESLHFVKGSRERGSLVKREEGLTWERGLSIILR
ncbi:MAG: hypothetical protein MJ249_12140 [Kiritimatiellae bacterium]|nr:hypothetical protein [Kiritimatiellia bacterium]